jgi:hypothetical protein
VFVIGDEPTVFDMGKLFTNEPFLGIPRAGASLSGDALNATLPANVLIAKDAEVRLRSDFDVIEIAFAG